MRDYGKCASPPKKLGYGTGTGLQVLYASPYPGHQHHHSPGRRSATRGPFSTGLWPTGGCSRCGGLPSCRTRARAAVYVRRASVLVTHHVRRNHDIFSDGSIDGCTCRRRVCAVRRRRAWSWYIYGTYLTSHERADMNAGERVVGFGANLRWCFAISEVISWRSA